MLLGFSFHSYTLLFWETLYRLVKTFKVTKVDFLKMNSSKCRHCKSCCRLLNAAGMEVDQWAEIQFTTLQWPNQSKSSLQLVLCKNLKDALEIKLPRGIFFLCLQWAERTLHFWYKVFWVRLLTETSVPTKLNLVRDPYAALQFGLWVSLASTYLQKSPLQLFPEVSFFVIKWWFCFV